MRQRGRDVRSRQPLRPARTSRRAFPIVEIMSMKANTKRIFTGTAGVYYVMYQLASRGFHASGTMGNAPYIDVLVSSEQGDRSVAIQVKTTEHAMRHRGRGDQRKPDHVEFPLGRKAALLNRPGVLFAFVDLAIWTPKQVVVYLVPSTAITEWCRPWIDKVKMVRLHQSIELMEPFRENWGQIASVVGDPPVVTLDLETAGGEGESPAETTEVNDDD
jgi:hypothetical protein